jgi:microcystin-dependent protein
MPRNSSGVYVQPASDVNPPIAGTVIDPVAFAAALTDISSEITNSLDRLGRAPMQAILQMAGFKISNLGAPVSPSDAARLTDVGGYFPPGLIGWFAGSVAPAGWLLGDGSAVSRTTYAGLFAICATTYGAGDGSSTFNLPDLRGVFVRGWDNGAGKDPARVFGSYQADMFASHTHIQSAHTHQYNTVTAASGGGGIAIPAGAGSVATTTAAAGLNQVTGGVETAPKNIALLGCIRT